MNERLFLYIDILGFSELINDVNKVERVYNHIDRLNVFSHSPYFKCIVFSDTILVYSSEDWADCKDRGGAIMWMCEFAQDLFYRLIGEDLHFRALLTIGEFKHASMTNINAFYGHALVGTYNHEKNIICMGLFMDERLVEFSNIFRTDPYDTKYHFVHIMQHLQRISFGERAYPFAPSLMLDLDTQYLHAYDLVYLQNVYRHMIDYRLSSHVRAKYQGTWQMLRTRSAALLDAFVRGGLDPRAISNFDWTEPMRRVGTPDGFYG